MTQCCHHCMNPPKNWLPVIVCPFLFLFWFCFCVSCFFGFVVCAFAVCLVDDDDGPLDYVQVLRQFSFVALNSRWP